MIEKIVLRNFKSIANIELPLHKLNVLIGRNGSGKSNFLNFFHLLREGANGNFNAAINTMGGFSQVLHYGAQQNPLAWELTFQDIQVAETVYYTGELAKRGTSGYTVRLEELERPPYQDFVNRYKYLAVRDGRVRILKSSQDEDEPQYDESDQELVIAQVRNRVRYPILSEVRHRIADWQIFRGFGSDALQNVRTSQVFNVVEPLRLDSSGINLVSVLQQLANEPQYESISEKLIQTIRTVFPDFTKLDIPISAGGMGSLNYRSRDFSVSIPAISMSDGQLRLIGLLVLLLLPNPPSLIAIDEPEVGLHPEALEVFAEVLQQASERTQIIIATHSPRLIDFIPPENVIVAERDNGQTILEHVNDNRLQQWLDRYTLGKLWTMGKLESR
ncbi:MAG: AAA family ATPase [Chloroflexi bacterium]|nr:AAA family ATPase [Chloroflexota bacterium]